MMQVEFVATVALFNVTEVSPGAKGSPPGPVSVAAPPQPVNVGETGFASITLAGRLSVNVVWVRAVFRSLFLIVIASWLTCPTHIVFGVKLLVNEGDWTTPTRRVALAGVVFVTVIAPLGSVEVNPPAGIVLMRLPGVVEVTSMDTVHDPGDTPACAGTMPPLKDRVVVPETAVTLPAQVLVRLTGFAMDIPGCTPTRLSVQAASISWNEFGLKIVTLRREVCPATMEIGEKLLLISAGKDT